MREGVRIAVDVGKVRIGLARSDKGGILAIPVETVPRDDANGSDVERILSLAREYEALEIVVGHPISMRGEKTQSTLDAEDFAQKLASSEFLVRLVDERLSTVSASAQLRESGRNAKTSRSVIDQVSAVIVLQHTLDAEQTRGVVFGTTLTNNLEKF